MTTPEPLTPEELGDLLVLYDRASLPQRNLIYQCPLCGKPHMPAMSHTSEELRAWENAPTVHVNTGSAHDHAMAWSEGYGAGYEDARHPDDEPLTQVEADEARAARQAPESDTEPCPTCMQPVPVPQRGDHDYGLSLAARQAPDTSGLRDALDAFERIEAWTRAAKGITRPTLRGTLAMVHDEAAKGRAALAAIERPLFPCWFCKRMVPEDALIAGYDTWKESRLACLACNERMQGNWHLEAQP